MTTEVKLETKTETEATLVTMTGERFHIPLTVLPVNISLGQTVWLTFSETLSKATASTPQEILNELLGHDESKKTA